MSMSAVAAGLRAPVPESDPNDSSSALHGSTDTLIALAEMGDNSTLGTDAKAALLEYLRSI